VTRLRMIAVALSVVVLGCGGGGDESPREQCEDLLDVICDRATSCILGAAGRQDECFDALQRVSGCDRVQRASARYDACVSRVEGQLCADLFQNSTATKITVYLPVECNDVVDLPQASGADRAGAAMVVSAVR
jgi:hypothetical protein